MLKQGSEVFSCSFDVHKAFDTVLIGGLLYKLFTELGINSLTRFNLSVSCGG